MIILSLDLSTKSSGWAVFKEEELIDYGCITSASTDLIKRIHIMTNGIKEVLNKYKIEKIVLEEVRPDVGSSNLQTHRALMWLQAATAIMVHDDFNKIQIEYIYPSSWRAACGIKNGRGVLRKTLKQYDIEFVKENFGIDVNDDIADAIGIGYSKINEVDNEINWE